MGSEYPAEGGGMTSYEQWRNFGYVSRLSEIKCTGPGASSNINTANTIAGQQLGVASQAQQQQQQLFNQFQSDIAPLQQQQTALASGNRQQALAAAMPVISQISTGFNAAKQNIMNNVPPGAARDAALAQLQTQSAGGIATAQANMVQQAPSTLASLGQGLGGMSLQELGAQLSGLSGGASTNLGAGQMAAAQQQSMLNFFTNLVGAIGSSGPYGGGYKGSSSDTSFSSGGGGGGGGGFTTTGGGMD
jgi:hypothetical protein